MWIGIIARRRFGNSDFVQGVDGPLARLGPADIEVGTQRFADLLADGENGVERTHRFLEDHADPAPTPLAPLALAQRQQVFAIEEDLSFEATGAERQEPHQSETGDGLAASAFANEPNALALSHPERDVAHDRDRSVGRGEGNAQSTHVE